MTYSFGNPAVASDYLTLRGAHDTTVAYANNTEAQNAVAALLGVGYGTRGYGYTALSMPLPTTGTKIVPSNWNALQSAVLLLDEHTGLGLSIEPVVSTGQLIQAFDGNAGRTNLVDVISNLDTYRYYADVAQMSLTNVLNSVRTSSWNYATNVYHEFTVDFGTEDAARFFFNTGGQLYISASRVGGADTALNLAVTQMLDEMGTIIVGANGVTYTGTNGNVTPIGYFQLTNTSEQIFSHYGDSSSQYSNISYIITAKMENYLGVNGGNGSLLRFQAIFRLDGYTTDDPPYTAYPPTVTGTLTSSVSNYSSTGVIPIALPTYTTVIGVGP